MNWTSLSDACVLVTDGTHYTPKDIGKGVPFITVKDLSAKGIDFNGSSRISQEDLEAARAGNSVPRPGDVLFSKDGTVGKVHVVNHPDPFAVLSSIAILRPKASVDSRYLGHILRAPEVLAQAARRKTGSGVPRIILSDLKRVEVPLPPLEKQRRIAEILDRANALRAKYRGMLDQLDVLQQSVFAQLFGDPSAWPSRWVIGSIGDLVESTQYGTSAKAGTTGEWPVLRMGNITDSGRLTFDDLKYLDLAASDVSKFTVRRGDLLFNRTNSVPKVGKCCVVETDRPLALAGYLVRVRFNHPSAAYFISAYLTSAHGRAVRKGIAKSAVNQANISPTELKSIPVALPQLELMDSFATQVRSIGKQRNQIERGFAAANELLASVQSRAFQGEL